jgi:hypothetical protein
MGARIGDSAIRIVLNALYLLAQAWHELLASEIIIVIGDARVPPTFGEIGRRSCFRFLLLGQFAPHTSRITHGVILP